MAVASRAALAALLVLCLVPVASARPDGPIRPFLEHQNRLTLDWPAEGTITDSFGFRWGRPHRGLDIGILRSLDVVAATSGAVASTGPLSGFEGYGSVVVVDVGRGYSLVYAHLDRIDVDPGQWVPEGERIGLAGCTGSCTGTHLHFELRRLGTPIDPLPFLARRGHSGRWPE